MDLFRNHDFVALYLSRNISRFGDQFTLSALLVLAALLTGGSSEKIAWLVAAGLAPGVLFGWVVGTFVDRWEKRTVMIGADFFRFLVVLGLLFFAHGTISLIALGFLVALGGTLYRPAYLALLPQAVGEDQVMEANALSQSTANVVDFAGMALAGLTMLLLSVRVAFAIDAVTFLASAACLSTLKTSLARPGKPRTAASLWLDVKEGLHAVTHHKTTRGLMAYMWLVSIPMGVFNTLEVLLAPDVAHVSVKLYPYFPALQGVAMTLAGLALARWGKRMKSRHLIVGGFLTSGAAVGALGFVHSYGAALGLVFVFGIGNLAFLVPVITNVQTALRPGLRARAMSFYSLSVNSALIIGTFTGGWLAARTGVSATLVLAGAAIFCVGCLVLVGRSTLERSTTTSISA